MKNKSLIFAFGFISALLVLGCMGFTSKNFDEYVIIRIPERAQHIDSFQGVLPQHSLNKGINKMKKEGWTVVSLGKSEPLRDIGGNDVHFVLFGK